MPELHMQKKILLKEKRYRVKEYQYCYIFSLDLIFVIYNCHKITNCRKNVSTLFQKSPDLIVVMIDKFVEWSNWLVNAG